ncbi:hypothetical protein Pla123a_47570 [Posidoniimonas polymericola]|uniref:Uncharacterized protein n=1 Tax=Posidoniimonas polymericola TaxID=2528002 RepID=A0A5C5XV10_9BACT|nr:hypothetical protein [Posidoniimonas polymericola]TWT66233.1 hypothetical protein Pla123a_47570 [Posidoniimonas polymericola]
MPVTECETRSFTRQEFYDFVWSAPATRLAIELGCSDVTIGKTCRSYNIPKPYPGYWVKLANGKTTKKTPLPPDEEADRRTIVFHQHEDYESTVDEPPRELQYDDDIRQLLAKATSLGAVSVPEKLRKPHPLILATKERLQREAAEQRLPWSQRSSDWRDKAPRGLSVEVGGALLKRALRIMDALIKRIEQVGGVVQVEPKHYNANQYETVVRFAGESVTTLRIREKHNQVRTKNPDAQYSCERDRLDLVPSGNLLLDDGPSSYRSPLAMDGKAKKIEDKLEGLVIGFVKEAGERRIARREREEKERRRAEAERIRLEREAELKRLRDALKQRQDEERARVEQLIHHADSLRQSEVLREYLDQLCWAKAPDGVVAIDSRLADYVRWGFEQADRLDPLRPSPHSVLDEKVDEDLLAREGHIPRKPR